MPQIGALPNQWGRWCFFPLPLPAPYNIAEADFSLINFNMGPTGDYLSVTTRSSVNSTADPSLNTPVAPPPIAPTSADVFPDHMITMMVSPYFVNSAAFVFAKAGLLDWRLANETWLSTKTFTPFAPGIKTYWPGEWPMTLDLALN